MNKLGDFEQNLLTELRQVVAEQAETPKPRPAFPGRRLVLATAGGGLLAAAAVIGVSVSGGEGPAPNYTVVSNDDGTITVRAEAFNDADGLERALEEHGISAEVATVPAGKQCKDWGVNYELAMRGVGPWVPLDHGFSWTLRPSVFKGRTLLLELADHDAVEGGRLGVADGPGTPCELVDAVDPIPPVDPTEPAPPVEPVEPTPTSTR